ncbi:MAG: cytochrome c3 family protein [Pseudomonadota bacterium]
MTTTKRIHMYKYLAAVAISLGLGLVALQIHADSVPKKVVIKKCGKKLPAVTFPHETHTQKQKFDCKKCHHKGKKATACVPCHAGKEKGKTPGCAEMSSKKNPYHILCTTCHKKMKLGPNRCKECHK